MNKCLCTHLVTIGCDPRCVCELPEVVRGRAEMVFYEKLKRWPVQLWGVVVLVSRECEGVCVEKRPLRYYLMYAHVQVN